MNDEDVILCRPYERSCIACEQCARHITRNTLTLIPRLVADLSLGVHYKDWRLECFYYMAME